MDSRPIVTGPGIWTLAAAAVVLVLLSSVSLAVEEYKSGIIWPEPPVVDPHSESAPPSDAIILFDGQDMAQWEGGAAWEIRDGYAIARKNGITSKQSFGDCQIHIEFATPEEASGRGQGRGNSGLYLMGKYELQILDSYENETYFDGQCGAIYKQQPPMVNASRKPGQWQTYDVLFQAPKFDDQGKLTEPAYITVLHNGVLIHSHYELQGMTSYTEPARYEAHEDKLPLHIQFHGNPVRFRNIWLRENLEPLQGRAPQQPPTEAAEQVTDAEKETPKTTEGADQGAEEEREEKEDKSQEDQPEDQ